MAITPLRLDGQTLGFQTTGADAISVLSLNIVSGAVTSSYLTDVDTQNLAPAVSELFTLVPSASRAANALGMLQRLVTVASSGSATVALTATNVGSVYTLVATPSGASFLIAHLPFSADGNLAWATGTGGSSLAVPVSLANGGTSTDLSGSAASQGAFFYGGASGSASLAPLPVVVSPISTNPSPANVAKNASVQINAEVKNGSVYYDTALNVLMQGQIVIFGGAVAFTDLTLTIVGGVGQIVLASNFATSGQFFLLTAGIGPNSGKAQFTVVTTAVNPAGVAGTLVVLLGPGPGSDVISGARTQLQFT